MWKIWAFEETLSEWRNITKRWVGLKQQGCLSHFRRWWSYVKSICWVSLRHIYFAMKKGLLFDNGEFRFGSWRSIEVELDLCVNHGWGDHWFISTPMTVVVGSICMGVSWSRRNEVRIFLKFANGGTCGGWRWHSCVWWHLKLTVVSDETRVELTMAFEWFSLFFDDDALWLMMEFDLQHKWQCNGDL